MSRKTRKLIWSAPLVAALAVLGALAIFAAQLPGTALAHEPPGIVTDIDTKTDGPNAIEISWTGASAATSYRIDYSMDGHVWKVLADGVTGTRHTHMGVPPGKIRYYRVFAINSAGVGPMSEIMSGETDAGGRPGSVTGLKATRMGFNAIKLEWQAPAENGGYAIKEYHIHVSDTVAEIPGRDVADDGKDASAEAVINTMKVGLTHTQIGLSAGDTRAYRVYAVNKNPNTDNNKSETAPTTRSASTAKQTEPSEPTGLLAVADDKVVDLYWYWPSDIGGADGENVLFAVEGHHTTADGITVTDWYTLEEAYSQAADSTIDYTHDNPAKGMWKYRVSTVGGDADDLTGKPSLPSRTVTFPNAGTVNDKTSIETDPDAGKVTNAVLEVPTRFYVEETRGKIVLTWDKVNPPKDRVLDDEGTKVEKPAETYLRPTGYRIDVSTDGIMWHRVPANAQPTQLTKTAYAYDKSRDGLKVTDSRFYRVFPKIGSNTGPAQDKPKEPSAAATTAPSMVQSVDAVGISATEIRVTWEPPEEDGNANIEYYLIDYRSTATGSAAFPNTHAAADSNREMVKGTMRSYTHEVDMGGTEMRFRVFAKNTMAAACGIKEDARCSPIATVDVVTATSLKAELPVAPKGLTAETAGTTNLPGITERGILLLWNAPDDPAGGDVNGYTVQRKVVGTDADFETLEGGGMVSAFDTYFTDTELPAADEMRQYRVRAYNNDEKPGPWSNTEYYPAQMHSHEPTEPTNVMASSDATGELMLTWEGGANADSYLLIAVNMADTSDYETMIVSDGAAQMGTVTGLTSGVNYLGIVVALQGTGADQTFAYGASGVQAVQ